MGLSQKNMKEPIQLGLQDYEEHQSIVNKNIFYSTRHSQLRIPYTQPPNSAR